MKRKNDDLSPQARAEDILLGSLGFGEEAKIRILEKTGQGYRGVGVWPDGEEFQFENDDELDDLQLWALQILAKG